MASSLDPTTARPAGRDPETSHRGFWSLIVTQFQGAFSDNAFKNLIILLILDAGLSATSKNRLVPAVLLLFSLPFILFSMAGGFLADHFSKRSATIGTKLLEVCIAVLALAGLWAGKLPLELAAIFLLSTQAALFGPSKYGLLPELLPERELSWGNGVLELGTFLAILTGTIAAGYLAEVFYGRQQWSGAILIALAFAGLVFSLGITHVPVADPERRFQFNFLADLGRAVSLMRRDHLLWQALMGNTVFWFLAGLLQPVVILYGKETLRLSDSHNTWLQAALAIGIGGGSLAAGYLSGGEIEYGLVPLGALGMAAANFWLGVGTPAFAHVLARLLLLGFFAGIFSVPILALVQHRPDLHQRGRILAATNLLSFLGIFAAGGAYYLLIGVGGLSPSQVFLAVGLLALLTAVYAWAFVKNCLQRTVAWLERTVGRRPATSPR
jgi:acyl-[acyl-carrier-protein]-phospholipid O-acyltransferase/long-chain-fatty-acid--[acyl-carrier-protein] ligase